MPQLRRSNLQLYGFVSTVLFLGTLLNAFRQRSNFYSAAVYLSKSNACMMILWNQGIFQTVMFGKLLQSAFFGPLRPLEVERLQERGWFAVTETLLALTIFRDEFDTTFILLFVSLLFLKVFHWLASDRIELMEQSTTVSGVFHLRMIALLCTLWMADAIFMANAIESIFLDGPTVMIMFASEYMILAATITSLTLKYGINVIDLRSEAEWEQKSIILFCVDLVTDFLKLVTYLTFFCVILTFYGLPLNILRDVYITLRSFVLKCRDLNRFRKATMNMDALYPTVSEIEMRDMTDKTCIICREDMEFRGISSILAIPTTGAGADGSDAASPAAPDSIPIPTPAPSAATPRPGPNDTPKRLPCGHVFHFHCLRSWLERQQSCPTCRRSVLIPALPVVPVRQHNRPRAAGGLPVPPFDPVPAAPIDPLRQAQINLARNVGREAYAAIFPGLPFPEEALRPAPTPTVPTAPLPDAVPATTPTNQQVDVLRSFRMSPATQPTAYTVSSVNPLAEFSLPDLPLPPAGEAALFSSLASAGYAGPFGNSSSQSLFGPARGPPLLAGPGVGVDMNPLLSYSEELLKLTMAKEGATTNLAIPSITVFTPGPGSPSSAQPSTTFTTDTTTTTTSSSNLSLPAMATSTYSSSSTFPPTPSSSTSASRPSISPSASATVTAVSSLETPSVPPTPREAALAAAESRQQQRGVVRSGKASSSPPTYTAAAPPAPTTSLASPSPCVVNPSLSTFRFSSSFGSTPATSTAAPDVASLSAPTVSTIAPTALPLGHTAHILVPRDARRLVPLSDYLADAAASHYRSSFVISPTHSKEVVDVLRSFEKRLDDLNREFKVVLAAVTQSSLSNAKEENDAPKEANRQGVQDGGDAEDDAEVVEKRREDKGKQAIEGIHAA